MITRIALVLAVFVTASLTVVGEALAASPAEVSLNTGYDLNTDEGAQKALRDLDRSARAACRQTDYETFLVFRYARQDCVDNAMRDAVDKAQSPILSANYDRYVAMGHSFYRAYHRNRVLYKPRPQELSDDIPAQAWYANRRGRADMDCVVREDYHLQCSVVSETHPELGFGQAALHASERFRAATHFADGSSTIGAHMPVAVRFGPVEED